MANNIAEFRVSRALTDAAVELQRTPTNIVPGGAIPFHYAATSPAVYWVEGLESVTGDAGQSDGNESSEIEAGRRLPGGGYDKVESSGSQQSVSLNHYGSESNLDDDEARVASRNFGLDRGEMHAMLALQQLRVNRDVRFNATLTAGNFSNTAARSGVWTTSSTTNNYIKADTETALNEIVISSGYTEAVVDCLIPYTQFTALKRAPELQRTEGFEKPAIYLTNEEFRLYLANYMGVREVKVLDAVRNTARFMQAGTGARVYTGDDVLFTVSNGDNNGNCGAGLMWTDVDGEPTDEPNPNGMGEAIFSGRNPLDEHETYRAKEQCNFFRNVALTYLITAISV